MKFLTDDEVNRIANAISARQRADLGLALDSLYCKMRDVQDVLLILAQEVHKMSDTNTTLDQAVADLDTAATSKIAEDQVLAAEAKQGRDEAAVVAADAAKVEDIVAKLNAETAAEKAADAPVPAPVEPVAQVNPIPTATVVAS